MLTSLSVIILTYNEAERLPQCVEAVRSVGDEILIVDSGSMDGTARLAKELGTNVLERPMKNWAEQRNWAMDQAKYSWVLFIDADEVLDQGLQNSILAWKEQSHEDTKGYWGLKRVHYFQGKRMRFSGLQSDVVVRLFHRSQRYANREVHEKLDLHKPQPLPGTLHHHTYLNQERWENKQRSYATKSAIDKNQSTGALTPFHFVAKPAFRFIKHYLLRGGILDGAAGWNYSISMAQGVYWRYVAMKKLRNS
jgi:glycosyltransferase involved in cell wall biosynthesis